VDTKGKPLAGYRPLLWLSLPQRPYSSASELEKLLMRFFYSYDAVWAGHADARHHGSGPKTDARGQVTIPALIPGATYRVALFGGKEKVFRVKAGETVNLADLTVQNPSATAKLPTIKPPK
jgi:hypothetical protein